MKVKNLFITILFLILFLCIGTNTSNASLYLNDLNFNVKINEDGSMNVTEKWNIEISETNTLFKTFTINKSKYSDIINVTVKDITNGKNKNFKQINEEMYHVTKDCYYSLINSKGDFEIAWGVSIESSENRLYEISYTITDAIKKYNDCAELYWKFIGDNFEIDAKSISGTIELPSIAEKKEDIRVWGHTDELNGEIYLQDLNKVIFDIDKYNSGNFVEIRITMPTYMIDSTKRMTNEYGLQKIIDEETIWANEANERRIQRDENAKSIANILIVITIALIILLLIKMRKYINIMKKTPKLKPIQKLEYYREVPDENINPAEAIFIMFSSSTLYFSQIFSAIMLDLAIKKYISFEETNEKDKKKKIKINILEKSEEGLKKQEKQILEILKDASKDNSLNMKMLEIYFEKNSSKINKIQMLLDESLKTQLEEKGYFSKETNNINKKYIGKKVLYYILTATIFTCLSFSIFNLISRKITGEYIKIILICGTIFSVVSIVDIVLCSKIAKRNFGFTQKGIDEKEKWKAFKKYMEEFSLLKEREVPELVIWEKYLVYATAFGISEKVLKQLKVVYANYDDTITTNNMTYMNLMFNNGNFNTNFISTLNSSISSVYSSGTGGGGGFSGGGGGRTVDGGGGGGR